MGGIVILLLAAGGSTRMRGADKLLEEIDGEPLLRRHARAMAGLGLPVIVTLPPRPSGRRDALEDLDVQMVEVADAASGMAASIRAGVRAAVDASGLVLLPADMPDITSGDVQRVIGVFAAEDGGRIVRGTTPDGVPGHPVIFPARCFAALSALTGDIGARRVLQGEDVVEVALPENHALTDLDTPEDWAAWRRRRGS